MENIKHKISKKMMISPQLLFKLAHKGGRIGKLAAEIDSLQSRMIYKGKGVYKK